MNESSPSKDGADELFASIFTEAGHDDPHDHWRRLREVAPVHRTAEGVFYVSDHQACQQVLRDPNFRAFGRNRLYGPQWKEHPIYYRLDEILGGMDAPDHTRQRGAVAGFFKPRRLEKLRDRMEHIVEELLAEMENGFDGNSVDFVARFALPLPVNVVGEVVGVRSMMSTPVPDLALHWTQGYDPAASAETLARADEAMDELYAYFGDLIDQRERAGATGDDLIAHMLATTGTPTGLSRAEMIPMLVTLCGGGFETTTRLLTNAVVTLSRRPDLHARLRAEPWLIPTAIEEFLRHDATVQFLGRLVAEDTELLGVPIPAGSPVNLSIIAANRDPKVFVQPDEIDIERKPNPHLTFIAGVHFCLGAHLARMEAQVALQAITRRYARLELAGPPVQAPGFAMRGYADVPLAYHR
ncbi:cytochrome P450 [Herbidospora sp. NEAU-GS84]|uniref:Cytochrome P450 n=1 Tax=Herbidospora solisilvae TaxID=2696284 RepID=A0A7C9JFG3_9ACTN|nr:cytochrome P450 [Herbidospora solisilvae]NAS25964.1 cytochrome P450 [Herbidospora solisilvae]